MGDNELYIETLNGAGGCGADCATLLRCEKRTQYSNSLIYKAKLLDHCTLFTSKGNGKTVLKFGCNFRT